MQSLFLTEEDVFEAKIFVAVDENNVIYCDKSEEGVKFLLEGKDIPIETYTVIFKKPSFGDLIALTDIVMRNADDITGTVNPLFTKLKTMSYLLKDWTFVDKDNNKIPAVEENLIKIDPIIAASIGMQFDDFLGDEKPEKTKDEDKLETEAS